MKLFYKVLIIMHIITNSLIINRFITLVIISYFFLFCGSVDHDAEIIYDVILHSNTHNIFSTDIKHYPESNSLGSTNSSNFTETYTLLS